MAAVQRNTATRNRHRATLRRRRGPCALCHEAIDYSLRRGDPKCFVVDHIVPLARGGTDELDNKQPAHWDCNQRKGDRLESELAEMLAEAGPRTFVTSRSW